MEVSEVEKLSRDDAVARKQLQTVHKLTDIF